LNRTALLFPGQGAQFVGMGRDLYESSAAARRLFDEADRVLGTQLTRLCFEGPEEELRRTHNTQPAIFVHSLAALRAMDLEPRGDLWRTAGHSLGEYTAYVAAGAMSFEDGLRLVRRRGELMLQAGRERPGTMAAVLGLSGEQVASAIAQVPGVVRVANHNSPGQAVLSGEVEAVRAAAEILKSAGAKKVVMLEVSGAFHSPLMEPAAAGLAEALRDVEIRSPGCVVLANATAQPVIEPAEIRDSLARQLLAPVCWEQIVRSLIAWGAERFLEVGPGKVLSGLVRSIDKGLAGEAVGTAEQVTAWRAAAGTPAGAEARSEGRPS